MCARVRVCRLCRWMRYVTEFDFRYNHRDVTDAERMVLALEGAEGKRLYYC